MQRNADIGLFAEPSGLRKVERFVALLETTRLTKDFGGVRALNDISLGVEEGEILGMIGPNGSGKSTFINVLTGIYAPDAGKVLFRDEDVTAMPTHRVTKKGVARTFQNLRVFQNVSVLENVLIGRHCRLGDTLWDVYFKPFFAIRREKEASKTAMRLLEQANLADRKGDLAKILPYGEQRLLEICRAVASDPSLLLLDEPCAGLNPAELETLAGFILKLRENGISIFIVEHNMRFMMSVAERIVVLDAGKKFREGLPADIQQDSEVQRIYLGEEEDEAC